MTDNDPAVSALERQLVAERHKCALLDAKLLEAQEELGRLRSWAREVENERYPLRKKWIPLGVGLVLAAVAGTAIATMIVMYLLLTKAGGI